MIGAPMTQTVERAMEIQFLGSFMDEGLGILMASPKRNTGLFLMFKPFTINAWLMCLGSVFLSAFVHCMIQRCYLTYAGTYPVIPREICLREHTWSYVRSLLALGPEWYPTMSASRVVIMLFWTFTLLMHAFWQADITAHLTREVFRLPFNTLEELAAQDKVRPLDLLLRVVTEADQNATEGSAYRNLYEKYRGHKMHPRNITHAIEILLNDASYALISTYNLIHYATQKHCGRLMLSDRAQVQNNIGFAVLPGATFVYQLSSYMTLMKETGITRRLEAKWWFQNDICSSDETRYRALNFRDVGGAVIILVFCILLGCLTLGLEKFWCLFTRFRCATVAPEETTDLPNPRTSVEKPK
ncbi:unnamed protein product [Echinostoma caproni]|uniref:PBPe domain-containing protein n=1 Tax=Echinostoma caproni TaxID=27848 RepID=A0A183AZV1_9TREM|nr:unnamed protein product [Echinostoma caproni]